MYNKNSLKVKEQIKSFLRRRFTGIKIFPMLKCVLPYNIVNDELLSSSWEGRPELYNAEGKRIEMVYIADRTKKYCMTAGRTPKYILWNCWDKQLPVHFYSHYNIADALKDKCLTKCLYLHESRTIIPKVYDYLLKHEEVAEIFDYIFTAEEEILLKYSNARFCMSSGLWYGTKKWGGNLEKERYKLKTKNISMLSSYKVRCDLHKLRLNMAYYFKDGDIVDTYGSFDGGDSVELCEALDAYRYSVVIENAESSYYFTEKILNCFAAQTVPIYIGATRIEKFFNINGIIVVHEPSIQAVARVVMQCNESDYNSRKDAIIDNYYRVKKYLCMEDYIYEHYGSELFRK